MEQIRKRIESTSTNISGSGMRLIFLGVLPPGYDTVFPELKQDTEALLHPMGQMENKE